MQKEKNQNKKKRKKKRTENNKINSRNYLEKINLGH